MKGMFLSISEHQSFTEQEKTRLVTDGAGQQLQVQGALEKRLVCVAFLNACKPVVVVVSTGDIDSYMYICMTTHAHMQFSF